MRCACSASAGDTRATSSGWAASSIGDCRLLHDSDRGWQEWLRARSEAGIDTAEARC